MPTVRLTKRTIHAIQPAKAGQTLYRDTDLASFGLRSVPGARSFSRRPRFVAAAFASPSASMGRSPRIARGS